MWSEMVHYLLVGSLLTSYRVPSLLPLVFFILYGGITLAFLEGDFSTQLVQNHSHIDQPLEFQLAAVWSSYEGAFLLYLTWIAFTSQFFSQLSTTPLFQKVLILFQSILFLLVNPYLKQEVISLEGLGINPLLRDTFLIIHPPMLYLGYALLFYPFILGWNYLTCGDYSLLLFKRASYSAWICLTLGIGLGSWWAYHELGWGGYWFWDPVENLALLPWIGLLTSIHLMPLKETTFRIQGAILAVLSFFLSLVGNYLMKSGLITSMHAFTQEPSRTFYLGMVLFFSFYISWKSVRLFVRPPVITPYLTLTSLLSWQMILSYLFMSILFVGSMLPLFSNGGEILLPFLAVTLLLLLATFYGSTHEKLGFFLGYGTIYSIFLQSSSNSTNFLLFLTSVFLLLQSRDLIHSSFKRKIFSHSAFVILISLVLLNRTLREEGLLFLQGGEFLRFQEYFLTLLQVQELKEGLVSHFQIGWNLLTTNLHYLGEGWTENSSFPKEEITTSKVTILTNGILDMKSFYHFENECFQWGIEPYVFSIWITLLLLVLSILL